MLMVSSGDGNGWNLLLDGWSNAGPRAYSNADDGAAFTTLCTWHLFCTKCQLTMDCGTAEGTVVFSYEAINKFSEEQIVLLLWVLMVIKWYL